MSRHRSSIKKHPPEIGLHMECVEEELEPIQLEYYNKAEKDYIESQKKLDEYVKKMNGEIVEKKENCTVYQLNITPPAQVQVSPSAIPASSGKNTRQTVQTTQNFQQVVTPGILTRSNSNTTGNTYLVMDSRLGFVVGKMSSSVTADQPAISPTPKSSPATRSRTQPPSTSVQSTLMVTTRAKSGSRSKGSETETQTTPATRTRDKSKQTSSQVNQPVVAQQQVYTSTSSVPEIVTSEEYLVKANAKPVLASSKPMESCALGGLTAGSKTPWKPNSDESNKNNADSKEVAFNKHTAKTFPSLVVVARPHIKVKYIQQANIHQQRSALDVKVKGVLMYTPAKFTEWLIQQGLIRSEQTCQVHLNHDLSPVKLKLGMYSDVSKFPYSGGYVWISDCCPSQFVSVFAGSIFEGAPHPPTTLLKLIYHWACQTNVQNVVHWVKVDNLYLKSFYTNMRAVCTQAVHEKYKKVGGPGKKIEVGVISLGTTSQDGNKRQVKVEVLGVMDPESKLVRLRAVEPFSDERNFKRRFVKILEPLVEWVHKESIILIDFTVAKAALNSMGFNTVYQVTGDPKYSNQNIMEYLRRIVPRMFQNTLSLLSRQIIQQFLDELVWREMWGPIPAQAFMSIVSHLAEITKLDVSENFLARLHKVASNPFKKWNYSAWKIIPASSSSPLVNNASASASNNTVTRGSGKVHQKASTSAQESSVEESSDVTETPKSSKGIRTRKRNADQITPEPTPSPVASKKVAKMSAKEKGVKKDKEPADKLPDEIIKFINEGKQISLESYYYASRHGDQVREYFYKGPFNVKCSVCNKKFTENIIVMKHMILHCQLDPVLVIDLKKVHQCDHCFLGFNTSAALKTHLEEVHFWVNGKLDSNIICHICEIKFKTRHDLVYHMQRTHVQIEMPYECGLCKFRTSVYKVFVDHFIEAHRGEDFVFCPYCLKIVSFSYKGEVITLNILFYLSHLEKHQRLSLVKDCNRCQLSFIHKGILDQHLDADHDSWSGESGLETVSELPVGVTMPEPAGFIKPAFTSKAVKSPKTRNLFASSRFKSLEVFGLEDHMECLECEECLTKAEHFIGSYSCFKCRFATCCEKAMSEHLAVFHEVAHPQFTKGRPTVLTEEHFCICGYSTRSGNRLAKHLVLCEKKTAYSSKEAATAVTKQRKEDKNKQGEGQNVLNMLGLVRKSPEVTVGSSDEVKMEIDQEDSNEKIQVKKKTEGTKDAPIESLLPIVEEIAKKGENQTRTSKALEEEKEEEDLERNVFELKVVEEDVNFKSKENGEKNKLLAEENIKDNQSVISTSSKNVETNSRKGIQEMCIDVETTKPLDQHDTTQNTEPPKEKAEDEPPKVEESFAESPATNDEKEILMNEKNERKEKTVENKETEIQDSKEELKDNKDFAKELTPLEKMHEQSSEETSESAQDTVREIMPKDSVEEMVFEKNEKKECENVEEVKDKEGESNENQNKIKESEIGRNNSVELKNQ